MCGICGYVGTPKNVDRDAMLSALVHRGPDGAGEYACNTPVGSVWLGHRRLSIIDLSDRGNQPMCSRDGRFALVFNGMIYNYRELRAELIALGHTFVSESDTEVLLSAWAQWGEAAITRLRGMFAFAIWDNAHRSLWLARDRMGEKPLYFVEQAGRLLFASEIRALLASGVVPRVLDPDGLDSYLAWGSVSQPYSIIQNVRRVGAGEVVRYTDGGVSRRQYWSLDAVVDTTSGREPMSEDEVVACLRNKVGEAIQQCMTADVRVGVLLSGGLDSTAILAQLTALGRRDVSTFSVVFDGVDSVFSEKPWSDRAAKRFGSKHHPVVVTSKQVKILLPEALAAMDAPSKDGVNHYMVLQAIARAGFKVAITGQGADELFFGYGNHRIYETSRRLARITLPQALARWCQRRIGGRTTKQRIRKVLSLLTPGDPDQLAYFARHVVFLSGEIDQLRGGRRAWPAKHVTRFSGDTPLDRLYRMESTNLLRDQLLRDGDQMSMACSLELRAPFVDHQLVESVTALPVSLKAVRGRQKPLLVDAINDPLVRDISHRPKVGFEIPIRRWVTQELSMQSIDPERLGMDRHAVQRIVRDQHHPEGFMRYWTLLVLHEWMARHDVAAA